MGLILGLATPAAPRDPAAIDDRYLSWAANLGVRALGTHLGPDPAALTPAVCQSLRERVEGWGMRIVQATAYNPNMVQPDPDRRRADLERLAAALVVAKRLGSPIAVAGCGSLNPDYHYGAHRDNHSAAARERLVDFLRAAAPVAEAEGVAIVLEPHLLTTLDTPANIRAMLDAVGSSMVQVDFDPVNLLGSVDAVFNSGAEMTRAFRAIGPHWRANAHVKDIVIENQLALHITEVPCGQGVLDFDTLLTLANQLGPATPLLVEHFPAYLAPAAIRFLRQKGEGLGIRF